MQDSRESSRSSRLLLALAFLLVIAAVQRLAFPVQRVPIWRGRAPVVAPDLHLTLIPLLLDSVASEPPQLAALVKRHAPDAVIQNRRLVSDGGGTVALGRSAAGQTLLQTCLMASGRAAVTEQQISDEIRATAPPGQALRLRRYLANLISATPMRRRDCLLVLLSSLNRRRSGVVEADLRQQWRSLQPRLRRDLELQSP